MLDAGALLAGGRLIDFILLLVAAEALVFALLYRRLGAGPSPLQLLPNLAAGASILMALRASLAGQDGVAICIWLALAGLAHCADMIARWRDRRGVAKGTG